MNWTDMSASEFVSSYLDAWNRLDAAAVADHLAEDGAYFNMTEQQDFSRQQLISYLDDWFVLEPYFYSVLGEVLKGERTIAFQYQMSLQEPLGVSGDPAILFGAEFITLRGGVAVKIVDYYDQGEAESGQGSPASSPSESRGSRYAKSGFRKPEMDAVMLQLSRLMKSEKVYLQADLALPDLAKSLGCSVNHLSQAINAGFGMSFFDYLNHYRVREAMRLFEQPGSDARTVLSVALEVGFNSTSTFYVAFKKVAGRTPAQYRRAQKN